jgi:histidyl-tRNA synthetase
LALRPEMTASVTRAYVDSLQGEPLPLRLCYAGPVFRYEKPQRGRFRQFTHVGLELIGSPHPMADAEIIYIACKGLNALGLKNYEVIIGHVGILAAYLEHLGIQSHLRSLLMRHMEALRQRGQAHVMTLLGEVYSVFQADDPADGAAPRAPASSKLADLLAAMDRSDARQIVLDFLDTLNIQLDEARDQHEIVDRLMADRNQRQTARVRQALDFMGEIGHLVGEPERDTAEAGTGDPRVWPQPQRRLSGCAPSFKRCNRTRLTGRASGSTWA